MNPIVINEFDEIFQSLGDDIIAQMRGRLILITGACGLIGSYLTDFLSWMNATHGLNCQIWAHGSSRDKLCRRFGDGTDLHFIEMDMACPTQFPHRFDYIIHLASPAHPAAYAQNPVGVMRANIIGTDALLAGALAHGGRFLFVSSGEIYGHNNGAAFVETDMGTISTTTVRSCYPESKRAAETLCISHAAQYGTHVVIARPCYVYGPTITDSNTRADADFLRAAIDGRDIVLTGSGTQCRTWCYVADVAAAMLQILLRGKSGDVFNIASPHSVASICQYAEILANIAGVHVHIGNAPACGDSILDGTRLMNLGWRPKYDLTRGLRHTFEIKKSK